MHNDELLNEWKAFSEREDKVQEREYRKSIGKSTPRELEQRGCALVEVSITKTELQWHGQSIITFSRAREKHDRNIPFKNGDILEIRNICPDFNSRSKAQISKCQPIASGVMHRGLPLSERGKYGVRVMMETDELAKIQDSEWRSKSSAEGKSPRYLLIVARCDVGYQRRMAAIKMLSNMIRQREKCRTALYNCLMSGAKSTTEYSENVYPLRNLNESQNSVVQFCIQTSPVSCIQGPPGTGKTTTIAALVKVFVERNKRVLVAAASNVAIDNVLEKCDDLLDVSVRIGHISRVSEKLINTSLEAKCKRTVKYPRLRKALDELQELQKHLQDSGSQNKEALRLVKNARTEVCRAKKKCWVEVFDKARLVVATCTGCMGAPFKHYFDDDSLLREQRLFDVVIVDEAGQIPEVDTWMAVLRGKRVILAGDIQQLGPTVLAKGEENLRIGRSMLARLIEMNPGISRTITMQYRMNKQIMQWSSIKFYKGRLQAHESVADRQVTKSIPPFLWLDTSEVDLAEEDNSQRGNKVQHGGAGKKNLNESSKSNAAEAVLVLHYLKTVLLPHMDIIDSVAIITPYGGQVRCIQDHLRTVFGKTKPESILNKIEVATVDGFQGREKTVVIISLVRSNPQSQIGFLSDDKRLNVAVTRAQKHCVIIGDVRTVTSHNAFKSIVSYVKSLGNFKSALNYISLPVWEKATIQIRGRNTKRPPALPKPTLSKPSMKKSPKSSSSPKTAQPRSRPSKTTRPSALSSFSETTAS